MLYIRQDVFCNGSGPMCLFVMKKYVYDIIGFMNSKVATDILSMLNPTINFNLW